MNKNITASNSANAGVEPGVRKGGRAKGQINKITSALLERVEKKYPGYDPIMAMVAMSQDEDLDPQLRLSATIAAAPYLRPKLRPVEIVPDLEDQMPTGDMDQWTEDEVKRVAIRARVTGDNSAAIAAHRLLADMRGTLKGGLDAKRGELIDMTPEEEEEAILREAEAIKARRGEG